MSCWCSKYYSIKFVFSFKEHLHKISVVAFNVFENLDNAIIKYHIIN